MKKIIFGLVIIFLISCSTDSSNYHDETSIGSQDPAYMVTKSNENLKITANEHSTNNKIQFTDGISNFIIDPLEGDELSLPRNYNFNPGFLDCFYLPFWEILDCLQNYIGPSEILYNFDPTIPDNPEGIAIDSRGDFIFSMALSGQVVKITKDGTRSLIATLPIGAFMPQLFNGNLGAVAIDDEDNIFVNVNASDPNDRGVWKIDSNGNINLFSQFPQSAALNGIAIKSNNLYIADSGIDGKIWKVSLSNGIAEVWKDDPLLKIINFEVPAPGANGIQYYRGEFYVSNPNQQLLLAINIKSNGSAGNIRIISNEVSFDDFAIDVLGNVIGTTNPFNTVEKIYPDGTKQTLLTLEDNLDGPTSAIFGRGFADSFNIYIANSAFPFFSTTFQPSLMKLELGIPGFDRSQY